MKQQYYKYSISYRIATNINIQSQFFIHLLFAGLNTLQSVCR